MPIFIALCLATGLSAACGLRIFIPPLVLSIAAHNGVVLLSSEWQWLGTTNTVIALSVLAVFEVLAYFIPMVGMAIAAIETPLAPIMGILISASTLSMAPNIDPNLALALSAFAGGGTSGTMHLATSATRAVTSTATGGCFGPFLSFFELIAALVLSILAITVPVLAIILVIFLLIYSAPRILKLISSLKRKIKERNSRKTNME